MSLSNEVAALTDVLTHRRQYCGICDWLASQGPEIQAEFWELVAARTNKVDLHRVCQNRGLPHAYPQFTKHCRECRP